MEEVVLEVVEEVDVEEEDVVDVLDVEATVGHGANTVETGELTIILATISDPVIVNVLTSNFPVSELGLSEKGER